MDKTKKTKTFDTRVNFRLSPADCEKLKALADATGKNHSQIIRDLLHSRPLPAKRNQVENGLLMDLKKLGNNLNQANKIYHGHITKNSHDALLNASIQTQISLIGNLEKQLSNIEKSLLGGSNDS